MGVGTCRAPCSHGRGQASKGAASSSPSLDSARPFTPSQASWLWGQRTLELEQAVTALSQALVPPSRMAKGLRHHGSTGADPLHGVWPCVTMWDKARRTHGNPRCPQSTNTDPARLQEGTGPGGAGCMGSNSRLIDPQPQAWQHQGDGRLIGLLSTKGTGMASSCPGMGQQQQNPHVPVPQGGMPWGIPAWWETASGCLVSVRRRELPCEGLLWEPPAATSLHTGHQVPPQPTCAGPGGGFRDWRSSSEHQFYDRGGLSSETNSCKRN